MKKVTLWKEENGKIKERIFKVKEIIYKEKYVIFILENGKKQVIANFKNFVEEEV